MNALSGHTKFLSWPACQTAPSAQVHYIAKLVNPHLSGDPIAVNFSTIMNW